MNAPTNQRFPFPLVAEAAGINYETMKRWALRGHLVMRDEDRSSMGRGGQRQLSFHTTLQAVIMAELVRKGVSLPAASEAAKKFAHSGDETRGPGELFQNAATFIVVNENDPVIYRVFKVCKNDSFLSVFNMASSSGFAVGAVFVNVQELLLNAARSLGMDANWIMETLED